MPSRSHDAFVLLFRNRPELAAKLLREALGVELPAYTSVTIASADLTELEPAEYRADVVVLLANEKPVFGIVVEVQLNPDPRKRFTWPVYATELRARSECEVVVLVVTPTNEVARWAMTPIRIGPGHVFAPLVLGPQMVPIVTDVARALADPELAVLSAMAHGSGDVDTAVRVAVAAVAGIARIEQEDRIMLYSDLVEAALGEAARKAFRMIPPGYEFQSQLARESMAEGREKGLAEGKEKGLAEGKAQALREALLSVLDARGFVVSEAQRVRVTAETDLERLNCWLRAAATVANAAEAFTDE